MLRLSLVVAAVAAADAFAPGATLPTQSRSVSAATSAITMQRLGSSRSAGSTPASSQPPQKAAGGTQPAEGGFAGRLGSIFGGSQTPTPAAPVPVGTQPVKSGGGPSLGSIGSIGSLFGKKDSAPAPPQGSQMVNKPKAAPAPVKAAPAPVKAAPKPVAARPVSSSFGGDGQGIFTGEGFAGTGRFQYQSGNRWDDEGADWARGGGIFGKAGGVTWAREAEVKHGRVCMLAAFGAIVQDLYTFPFMDKWYSGEKMWGLHEASVKSGALWQVLFFIGWLELPFLIKLREGTLDGTGDIGFDPAGLKNSPNEYAMNQVREIKNGRLAMIAISGMTHHYFLTGKGPIEFASQIPNFKSCAQAAVYTGLCK